MEGSRRIDPGPGGRNRRRSGVPWGLATLLVAGVLAWLVLAPGHHRSGAREPGLGPPTAYDQPPIVVNVFEYGFSPSRAVILTGQVVAWRNVGKQFHLIRPLTDAGRRVFLAAERLGSANHLFLRPGRYPYHCSIHPRMRGVIVVRRRH